MSSGVSRWRLWNELDAEGRLHFTETGESSGSVRRVERYLDEYCCSGRAAQFNRPWADIDPINSQAAERTRGRR